jgi:hypothetical protein
VLGAAKTDIKSNRNYGTGKDTCSRIYGLKLNNYARKTKILAVEKYFLLTGYLLMGAISFEFSTMKTFSKC